MRPWPPLGRRAGGRRGLFSWAILAWLAVASAAAAASGAIQLSPAGDLAADAARMREQRIPMVILFSRSDCRWCEKARREHLIPLANDPAAKALVRQVDMDRDTPLADFDGRATSHRAFANRHKARLAPTLMFFGPDARQLAEPIVGFRLPDFYGAYIEQSIDEGLAQLRKETP